MSAIEQQDSHRPPSDGGMAKEEFIRVGTTLYNCLFYTSDAADDTPCVHIGGRCIRTKQHSLFIR